MFGPRKKAEELARVYLFRHLSLSIPYSLLLSLFFWFRHRLFAFPKRNCFLLLTRIYNIYVLKKTTQYLVDVAGIYNTGQQEQTNTKPSSTRMKT